MNNEVHPILVEFTVAIHRPSLQALTAFLTSKSRLRGGANLYDRRRPLEQPGPELRDWAKRSSESGVESRWLIKIVLVTSA